MGARQVKCSCGENATHKVIVHAFIVPEEQGDFVGFTSLGNMTEYKGWSTSMQHDESGRMKYEACPCKKCTENLSAILQEIENIHYEMIYSNKGWWQTDLP